MEWPLTLLNLRPDTPQINVYTHHVALRLPTRHGQGLHHWTLLLSKMCTSLRAMHMSFQDSGLESEFIYTDGSARDIGHPDGIEAVQESSGLHQAEGLL